MLEAGAQRGVLAEVAREANDPDGGEVGAERDQPRHRIISAAVVDEDDLMPDSGTVRPHQLVDDRADAVEEGTDALRLVEHRHDQREADLARLSARRSEICHDCCARTCRARSYERNWLRLS